jgi:hypothetical protein
MYSYTELVGPGGNAFDLYLGRQSYTILNLDHGDDFSVGWLYSHLRQHTALRRDKDFCFYS